MTYQSEAQSEDKLIDLLVNDGYGRIHIKDEYELNVNFREQLNIFNKKNLDNIPLTDHEFERFLTQIDGKSIFQSAKMLRMKQELTRDDGTKVFLELMNTQDWCKNNFQASNQNYGLTLMQAKHNYKELGAVKLDLKELCRPPKRSEYPDFHADLLKGNQVVVRCLNLMIYHFIQKNLQI